jgi:hypothetical protein
MGKRTIWVIESGSYSDYRVDGVYSSKKNAEMAKRALKSALSSDMTIREWELDPGIEDFRKGYDYWHILMLRDGTVEGDVKRNRYPSAGSTYGIWKRTEAPATKGKGIPGALLANVWARNAKHAVKIVNEKRAQMIANGEWA